MPSPPLPYPAAATNAPCLGRGCKNGTYTARRKEIREDKIRLILSYREKKRRRVQTRDGLSPQTGDERTRATWSPVTCLARRCPFAGLPRWPSQHTPAAAARGQGATAAGYQWRARAAACLRRKVGCMHPLIHGLLQLAAPRAAVQHTGLQPATPRAAGDEQLREPAGSEVLSCRSCCASRGSAAARASAPLASRAYHGRVRVRYRERKSLEDRSHTCARWRG